MDKNLENRIAALEKWRKERENQQVTFPLDSMSITILNKYFMSIVGTIIDTNFSGVEFTNWIVRQGPYGGVIGIGFPLFRYTASAAANTLTIGKDVVAGTQGVFNDDERIYVRTPGTLPDPLISGFPYFVVNSSAGGTVIQLSDTLGGAAIDLTTAGVGEQYIESAGF